MFFVPRGSYEIQIKFASRKAVSAGFTTQNFLAPLSHFQALSGKGLRSFNYKIFSCYFTRTQGHPTTIFGKHLFGRRFEI